MLACGSAIAALIFALITSLNILKKSEGNEKIKKIAAAIRKGANAYLKRQYLCVIVFFAAVTVILIVLALTGLMSMFVPLSFLSGGVFSAISGYIGMKIATASNSRTVVGAKKSLNSGLRIAFSSGSVMGMTVVGLGLLYITLWYFIFKAAYNGHPDMYSIIGSNMLYLGMGASCMALFARVGGGIFTKAADVGADLVGKVEAGLPEDDHRNPATIADNVGDNVGDVAGMGADLYESYIGSIVSAAALSVSAGLGGNGLILPMLIAGIGIISSLIGTAFVRTKEGASQKNLLNALHKGTYISSALTVAASFFLVKYILGMDKIGVFISVVCGLAAGIVIGLYTEYITSDHYKPTKKLAASSETGTATTIINGIGLGMRSTFVPIAVIAASVLICFIASGGTKDFATGLYGIAISAVGMLSTLGITLATDAYGPVADNAGGIAAMSGEPEIVRERTDALDSLGNTTAAIGKGFAIGSAALTALALLASFVDKVKAEGLNVDISLLNPSLLMGLFIGAMLPFLFSSMTMNAVGSAAQKVVIEVRRQLNSIKGLLTGEESPDYEACVDICTKSSLKQMIAPAILGFASPIIVGLILGASGVMGMLAGSIACGFVLALMMSNSGGAWDNAKKYIENGNHGGKNGDAHHAAVVGDTVGDPFKDTAGPSINILVKLMSIVAIVFASIITKYSIF